MLASVLTTFFFALSAVSASRSAGILGPVNANCARLILAALLLTGYALAWGQGLEGPGCPIFFLSGLVGFGLGDVALFYTYRHLGARRGVLLAQCLAVPFAALTEWVWLGTGIATLQLFLIGLILSGVALAVTPQKNASMGRRQVLQGIGCGVLAGLGQAWGAVLSRKAVEMNVSVGLHVDGWTAAFQRIWAGVAVALIFFVWFRLKERPFRESPMARLPRERWPEAFRFCALNAMAGPVIGVGCYQWALSEVPSALVLAVVATTPIVVMPMSWYTEKDRPGLVPVVGAVVAVVGVIALLNF